MKGPLADRIALITGGGSGIGRATALRLAAMGAGVAVSGRRAAPLCETSDAVAAAGGRALAVPGDVAAEADAERMVAATVAHFGRLDLLVNGAAVVRKRPLVETSVSDFRAVVDANLLGTFLVCRAAIPRMSDGGAIVNVATGAAIRAVPGFAVYGASKAAVLYLTRVIALECAPRGIRVNAVSPGSVDTPIHETFLPPEEVAGLPRSVASWTPLGRMARADEIASAIAYLLSPEASYITGINLSVDGGSTAA
jgi:NAD(P)-dependent dehydrogenase (short-subunit alcohol dehydrogenase family)